MRSGKHRKADNIGVFLQRSIDDLFGSLPQPGIDDFETGIAKGAGNHFRTTVMPVKAGFGNDDADLFVHP